MTGTDLLIIGSGPAGMAAAILGSRKGLSVTVVDDQPAPGGQIWRAVGLSDKNDGILGSTYTEGRAVVEAFRNCRATYLPSAQVWKIEPGFRVYLTRNRKAEVIDAKSILLATGAQERPAPFQGWTLPGVMTVGAAQILLKSADQIPSGRIWIAGSGPLPLLYATQFLGAGGKIAGYLDTTPPGQWRQAARHLPQAWASMPDIIKGLGWGATLRAHSVKRVSAVEDLIAIGDERLERLHYRSSNGVEETVDADLLLVHEGVVPSVHMPMSLGCAIRWDDAQDAYAPSLDEWGESSVENLFIAGDGAGIGGAKAAGFRGELSALRLVAKLGHSSIKEACGEAAPIRAKLKKELAIRPFLDAMFKPRASIFQPADETIICRCEEVTAGNIRALAAIGEPGPNQVKAACRAGMGPCQGRQCGYTITRLLAAEQKRSATDVGFLNIRAPLKPVTIGELASLTEVVCS